MEALRRFAAIVMADLRERSRNPRFWIVLALVALATWQCFPSRASGLLAVSLGDDARGAYSSAWVGLTLALVDATLLSLVGFYLVRGTLVRDFDTRVWQLLVATPMTRTGYLLAKWASHMAVFGLLLMAGLLVGLAAQWLRAEDRAIDLLELCKPTLILALPSLAVTAFLAVLFDLLPWTRGAAGNVLYFFVWLALLAGSAIALDPSSSGAAPGTWLSDPGGMVLVTRDLARELSVSAPWAKVRDLSVSIAMGEPTTVHLFAWTHWSLRASDLAGRLLWVLLPMFGIALLAPGLDRAASHVRRSVATSAGGRSLRWLDRLLRPLERMPAGQLVAAELKLVLRQRRTWWWLALAICWVVQSVGKPEAMGAACILAWVASTDVFSRVILRERDTRTAALVFTSTGAARQLLVARSITALVLAVLSVAPAWLRLCATDGTMAISLLLMAADIACVGLASAALFRNPRLFELAFVLLAYAGLQGHGPLALLTGTPATLVHGLVVVLAMAVLLVCWPGVQRPAWSPNRGRRQLNGANCLRPS